jgi:hypothetical protein
MGRQRVAVWVNEERYKQGNETITSCGTVVVLCTRSSCWLKAEPKPSASVVAAGADWGKGMGKGLKKVSVKSIEMGPLKDNNGEILHVYISLEGRNSIRQRV